MSSGLNLVGTHVGQYDVLRVIGRGGMGAVFEGLHPLIHKRVAIKVLHPHLSANESMVGRFLSEAQAVNSIGHRGIIDIFGFGQLEGGDHYFVMELLEGRSFEQLLHAYGSFGVARVAAWGVEILDALAAAHAAGVVHRDLKPSNLFLVEPARGKGYVKVLDFGIAKLLTHGPNTPTHTRTGLVGTPSHISPEQVTGAEITPATDLYALGCVLFELLTGHPPFEGDSALAVMNQHVNVVAPLLSERATDVPPALDALVAELLRKRPEERPASAEGVRERLADIAQAAGEPEPLPRPPPADADLALTRPAFVVPDGLRMSATDAAAPVSETRAAPGPKETRVASETVAPEVVTAPAVGSPTSEPPSLAQATPPGAAWPSSAPAPTSPTPPWVWTLAALGLLAAAVTSFMQAPSHLPRATEKVPSPSVVEIPLGGEADAGGLAPDDEGPPDVATPDTLATATSGEPGTPKKVVTPPRTGPTPAQLKARLAAVEKKLVAHEKSRNDQDPVVRAMLLRAREAVRVARTPEECRAANALLKDVEAAMR